LEHQGYKGKESTFPLQR